MSLIQEIPPLMVLAEDSADRQMYRFRGGRWGIATLVGGLGLIGVCGWFQRTSDAPAWPFALFYLFGILLLYSALYSFTAHQWLLVDGTRRSIRFHKKNLYGRVEWERAGSDFKEIRVFRPARLRGTAPTKTWAILLVGNDGVELFIGENEFGAFNRDRALALAGRVGRLAGIPVSPSE
jgi:hypothetical protein